PDTRGRSPVRKSRTPGSVRGVSGNGYPYRDKWVFINEDEPMPHPSMEYNDFSIKMQRYIERIQRSAKSDWAIFNLYAVGFSHACISKITGVGVQTSKNTVSKIKKELSFDDRDYIIMSSIYTLSYGKFISNVVSILKDGVNFLLNQ
ncbi:hypothetical protein AB8S51_25570, partial [Klebsiella pneumoniae]